MELKLNFSPPASLSRSGSRSPGAERFRCSEPSDDYAGPCGLNHGIYRKIQFAEDRSIQLPGGYPLTLGRIGEPSEPADRGWAKNLGEVPKDCYYCKTTGKCYLDSPPLGGSGKDYMGKDCNACSGSGICPRCAGDGILGKPGSSTVSNH